MTLPELVTTLGPVAGVFVFMWLNRGPLRGEKSDPFGSKLDALLEEARRANGYLAILLDRSDR